MHKVREDMESSDKYPMDGIVNSGRVRFGRSGTRNIGCSYNNTKKKKAVTTVQLKKEGKFRLMYGMGIEDFSARYFESIFANHIS